MLTQKVLLSTACSSEGKTGFVYLSSCLLESSVEKRPQLEHETDNEGTLM